MVQQCVGCLYFRFVEGRLWSLWKPNREMKAEQFAMRQFTICPECYSQRLKEQESKNAPCQAQR